MRHIPPPNEDRTASMRGTLGDVCKLPGFSHSPYWMRQVRICDFGWSAEARGVEGILEGMHVYAYVNIHTHNECMHARKQARMHACMYLRMYACMSACMYVCKNLCM